MSRFRRYYLTFKFYFEAGRPNPFLPLRYQRQKRIWSPSIEIEAFHQNISIKFDNSLRPGHTPVEIACKNPVDDVLITFKEYNFRVSYGRLSKMLNGKVS